MVGDAMPSSLVVVYLISVCDESGTLRSPSRLSASSGECIMHTLALHSRTLDPAQRILPRSASNDLSSPLRRLPLSRLSQFAWLFRVSSHVCTVSRSLSHEKTLAVSPDGANIHRACATSTLIPDPAVCTFVPSVCLPRYTRANGEAPITIAACVHASTRNSLARCLRVVETRLSL